MPRIAKWILAKEWLSLDEVVKVRNSAPSELENVFSKDESDEFKQKYKFVCTFCPRLCETVFKEFRFEETARLGMRNHIKDHVKALKKLSLEEQADFLTRNQLYQPAKGQKHKMASVSNEQDSPPSKKSKTVAKPAQKRQPASSKKQFTQLKRKKKTTRNKGSTDSESPQSSSDAESNGTVVPPLLQGSVESMSDHSADDLSIEIKDEIPSTDEETDVPNENDPSNKDAGCQTQTVGKQGVETLQYRMATRLFAMDRSQWDNAEQVLDELLAKEVEQLSEEDRSKVLFSMDIWKESNKESDSNKKSLVRRPLSPIEDLILDNMTTEEWQRLDTAKDEESKVRLMVRAQWLLRQYIFWPRKLKERTCRHCQREYTASTSLHSHLMSLSGIRLWVCRRCVRLGKEVNTFTRKHSLQYHILKEAGIPRYRCSEPGCSKTHNHTHHQKSHARQHTGVKHYICRHPGCKSSFSNRNTYSRHLLQKHNAELTKDNKIRVIELKAAQLKVYAARLKARERSKNKRQRSGSNGAVEKRALTRLMQNEGSPNTPEIEDLLKPSAAQALYRVARDIRKERADTGILGGLNLLATVSNYMNVEECRSTAEKEMGHANNNNKCPGFTKLIEALDIQQSPRKNHSVPMLADYNQDSHGHSPIPSSHGLVTLNSPIPCVCQPPMTMSRESASVVSKPTTVLLPLPSGRMNAPNESAPAQTQRLPNTIENLKARLMADNIIPNQRLLQVIKPPAFVQSQPPAVQVVRPVPQSSMMQVIRPIGDDPQLGSSKIIINLAQQIPVASTTASMVIMSKPGQATMSSLLPSNNQGNITIPAGLRQDGGKSLPNSLFGTSYFVVAAPHVAQPQTRLVKLNTATTTTTTATKAIPFSHL